VGGGELQWEGAEEVRRKGEGRTGGE